MPMKTQPVMGFLFLLVGAHCCYAGPAERLKLWMTYDEAVVLLQTKAALRPNPSITEYQMTAQERKLTVFYGLASDEDDEVVLGFNADKELIMINRVERAKDIPPQVLERMMDPQELERRAVRFRAGPGEGRVEAWNAMAGLLQERIAKLPQEERTPFVRRLLGEPDGVKVPGYRPGRIADGAPDKSAVQGTPRLSYILSAVAEGHDLVHIDCNAEEGRDFASEESVPLLPQGISEAEGELAGSLGASLINLGLGGLDGRAKTGFAICLQEERVSADTLRKAARLQFLVSLRVAGPKFDDASLRIFSGHKYLASITLGNTATTAAGLAVLGTLPELKWVTITESKFSDEDQQAIRKALPRCEFEFRNQGP